MLHIFKEVVKANPKMDGNFKISGKIVFEKETSASRMLQLLHLLYIKYCTTLQGKEIDSFGCTMLY